MPIPEWLAGYMLVLLIFQFVILWLFLFRSDDSVERSGETTAERVVCVRCNEQNHADYQFCRSCVEELPGSDPQSSGTNNPISRWIR